MAEVEEESLASADGVYRLPEDTREEILAMLPLDCLCKCRSVCKEWNAFFSSTRFITNKWAETPSNKNPWLLLSKVNFQMGWKTDYSAYCFFAQTWKTFISFSFLPEGHKNVKCSGAAEGLFLVDIPSGKLTIGNPLTHAFLKFPSMSLIKIPGESSDTCPRISKSLVYHGGLFSAMIAFTVQHWMARLGWAFWDSAS